VTNARPWTPILARQMMALAPALLKRAKRLVRNPSEAQDLVSDVLARAWQFRGQFEPGTDLERWLMTILRNLRLDHHRRRTALRRTPDSLSEAMHCLPEHDAQLEMRDAQRALDALPDTRRQMFLAAIVDEREYQDIAAQFKVPVGTVRSNINRARAALSQACDRNLA